MIVIRLAGSSKPSGWPVRTSVRTLFPVRAVQSTMAWDRCFRMGKAAKSPWEARRHEQISAAFRGCLRTIAIIVFWQGSATGAGPLEAINSKTWQTTPSHPGPARGAAYRAAPSPPTLMGLFFYYRGPDIDQTPPGPPLPLPRV